MRDNGTSATTTKSIGLDTLQAAFFRRHLTPTPSASPPSPSVSSPSSLPPPPSHARCPEGIRVLISTDILSEGLNLQDVTRMINYDLHWNPVRLPTS